MQLINDLFKNPLSYWVRSLINKYKFLSQCKSKNIKIDYMSYITDSIMNDNSTIYQNVRLHNVDLGSFSYVANDTRILGANIGKFCSIGPSCRIGLGKHPSRNFVSTHPIFFSKESHVGITFTNENLYQEFGKITIGNDVWIGANVIIKDDLNVGDGAIIGAGSIVTKNVADFAIVAGNPAKLIRYRFTPEQIEKLKLLKWWDMDIKELEEIYTHLDNIDNIDKF